MATKEMTSQELEKVRSSGQFSRLFLAIRKPTTIFTALVNGTVVGTSVKGFNNDMVGEVPYDTGVGSQAGVRANMTMLVGSTPGGREKGIVRLRKAPTEDTFYVGEESYVDWADNDYLTVLDDPMGPWPKHIKIIGEEPFMDFETGYTDQHLNFEPVVMMGPAAVILEITDGVSVTFNWPSVADSFDPSGVASISAYQWNFPDASGFTGETTATPTVTYNAGGQYMVYCRITLSNGKSFTACRPVFVFDDSVQPVTSFKLVSSPIGVRNEGGWTFEIEMQAGADNDLVEDRTMVVLFAKDYYDGVEGSVGPLGNYSKQVCFGWIDGDTIEQDPVNGSVKFRVAGPHSWLGKITGFPIGIENRKAGSNAWTNMKNLTPRMFAWHLLHWRSTIDHILDLSLTGDTRQLGSLDAQQATLWAQLQAATTETIFAQPMFDRYGTFFCHVNQQLVPSSGRTGFPLVLTLTKKDWEGTLTIIKRDVDETTRVELSGVKVSDAASAVPYFSLSPGHVGNRYGDVFPAENLLLSSQSQANTLAGLITGWSNRQYDFEIAMVGNNRMIDIAPRSFIGMNIAEADTLRGVSYVGNAVPTSVEYVWDEERSRFSTRISAEQESVEALSIDGDIPPDGADPPTIPPIDPPIIPPVIPPVDITDGVIIIHVGGSGIFYCEDIGVPDPPWIAMNDGLDSARVDGIISFDVTPDGALFLLTSAIGDNFGYKFTGVWNLGGPGTLAIGQEVWFSEGVGEPWTKVFDNLDMTPSPYAFPRSPAICALGVIRDESDSAALVCNGQYTILGNKVHQSYSGGSGGFDLVEDEIGIDLIGLANPHALMVQFLGGTWGLHIHSIPEGTNVGIFKVNAALTSLTAFAANSGGWPCITTSREPCSTGIVHSNPTRITTDAGFSFPSEVTHPIAYGSDLIFGEAHYQSSGVAPDGEHLLIGDIDEINLKRSTDSGATWGNAPAVTEGPVTALWCLNDEMIWIAAIDHALFYTEDFFTTMVEITGDLLSWDPSASIISIRSA